MKKTVYLLALVIIIALGMSTPCQAITISPGEIKVTDVSDSGPPGTTVLFQAADRTMSQFEISSAISTPSPVGMSSTSTTSKITAENTSTWQTRGQRSAKMRLSRDCI